MTLAAPDFNPTSPHAGVTVLGGRGFVGRHLVARLQALGQTCWVPERNDPSLWTRPLGQVFYCIGLTANFREQPFATVDAHVGVLRAVLERAQFGQLIYLSSTRVYDGGSATDATHEDQPLQVRPASPDHLYNLSKLMGESLALSSGRNCRVVRLSNVIGPGMGATNFLGSVLQEAVATGAVHFKTALQSGKDYLWIDDAVDGLLAIANRGHQPVYNLASGSNTSHQQIAACLERLGIAVTHSPDGLATRFPPISTQLMQRDTTFSPAPIQPRLMAFMSSVLNPVPSQSGEPA